MPTAFSLNVNKIALLRNSRGEGNPDVVQFSKRCLDLGADGITVHPRPDGRHIRYSDVYDLKALLADYPDKEFNIEGYPNSGFLDLIQTTKPDQVTLVPDPPDALTSSFGWDVAEHRAWLKELCLSFREWGVRSSLFIDPDFSAFEALSEVNPDRIELYTYDFAHQFSQNPEASLLPYKQTAERLIEMGIGINAGHDLTYDNVRAFIETVPQVLEVSIGHAFVCDALYFGLEKTFQLYFDGVKGAA